MALCGAAARLGVMEGHGGEEPAAGDFEVLVRNQRREKRELQGEERPWGPGGRGA